MMLTKCAGDKESQNQSYINTFSCLTMNFCCFHCCWHIVILEQSWVQHRIWSEAGGNWARNEHTPDQGRRPGSGKAQMSTQCGCRNESHPWEADQTQPACPHDPCSGLLFAILGDGCRHSEVNSHQLGTHCPSTGLCFQADWWIACTHCSDPR